MQHTEWAQEEFGGAQLGNRQRTTRLVEMARAVMGNPHAIVLKALRTTAEREGAYRFLESEHISTDAIEATRAMACLKRMEAMGSDVIIPIDQTSFTLPDHTGERDFGSVGNRSRELRGVHLLTALALDVRGAPLGVLAQVYWTRSDEPGPARVRSNKKERDHRPPEDKESMYWTEILTAVCERVEHSDSDMRPWLQCDRGADFWSAFDIAAQHDILLTVRVYTNRQIVLDDGARGHLMPWMNSLPKLGVYEVAVPAREDRPERTAKMSVRYGRVQVRLGPTPHKRKLVPLYFVYAQEEEPPADQEPLCWRLATTFPVHSFDDALRVVANYKLRWRIEEFHRTQKSGACDLENSQLESFEAFRRWAIIHSSVAARVERLKLLARTEPDAPASVEFSREEIDTAIILRRQQMVRKKPPYRPGDTPTLGEMIFWIADFGGYAGNRTKPKPGSVPLARGLERFDIAVNTLRSVGYFEEGKK